MCVVCVCSAARPLDHSSPVALTRTDCNKALRKTDAGEAMAQIPLLKLGSLLVRTLAKPIAKQIKDYAKCE